MYTVNPQTYTGVNVCKSAQYSDSASKISTAWWLKSKSTMPLINFHTCNFRYSHLQKTQRLNTCEHFWIYSMQGNVKIIELIRIQSPGNWLSLKVRVPVELPSLIILTFSDTTVA